MSFFSKIFAIKSKKKVCNNLEPLGEACAEGTLQDIVSLIEKGEDINQIFIDGGNVLHVACAHNRSEDVIEYLIHSESQQCKNINDKYGNALLFWRNKRCRHKHLSGDNISLLDAAGNTPLHLAVRYCPLSVIKLLLEHGADTSAREPEGGMRNVLHVACLYQREPQVIQSVLDKMHAQSINHIDDEGYTPLHLAVKSNSFDTIKLIMQYNADLNIASQLYHGGNILHIACRSNRSADVFGCILRNISPDLINEQDSKDRTPLYIAVRKCSLQVIQLLLLHGSNGNLLCPKAKMGNMIHVACKSNREIEIFKCLLAHMSHESVNTKDELGYSPLHLAVTACPLAIVQLLIKHEADLDVICPTYQNGNILHFACRRLRDTFIFRLLLKNMSAESINSNAADVCGTPLQLAVSISPVSIIKLLICNKADVNKRYPNFLMGNVLHIASFFDRGPNVFKYLLERMHPDSVNVTNSEGCTPLHIAVTKCSLSVIKLLLNYWANENLLCPEFSNGNILHIACKEKRDIHLFKFLFNFFGPETINLTDDNGDTPLHLAVKSCHSDVIELFTTRRADVSLRNAEGKNALHIACITKREPAVIEHLLEHISTVDIDSTDNNDCSPLYYAAQAGQLSSVELILQNGANVSHIDKNGRTILHSLCQSGSLQTIREIIKAGASVNARDVSGMTPLIEACVSGQHDLIDLLVEACPNRSLTDMHTRKCVFATDHQITVLFTYLESSFNMSALLEANFDNIHFLIFSLWSTAPNYQHSDQTFRRICHLSSAAYNLLFCTSPFLPINSYEKYIHLAITCEDKIERQKCFQILGSLRKNFPSLMSLCRAQIRLCFGELLNNFGEDHSILPIVSAMMNCDLNEKLLTDTMVRYVFMYQEAVALFPSWNKRIDELFQISNSNLRPFSSCHDYEMLPSTFEQQPSISIVKVTNSDQTNQPEWILADMAGICVGYGWKPIELKHDLVDLDNHIHVKYSEKPCAISTIHSVMCRLYRTFLKLITDQGGIKWKLLQTGSYHHDVKVGEFTEIDFVAEMVDAVFETTEDASPLHHRVTVPLHMQNNIPILMKHYLHAGMVCFLKDGMALIDKESVQFAQGQVHVQSCCPNKFSPAVCTVFEWSCQHGHVHELSVVLTPAIPFKKLGEIHSGISVLDKGQFRQAKEELLDTNIHLVPMKDPHFDIENDTITSLWQVSYFITNKVVLKCLDRTNTNIKLCYRIMKYIRDVLFPYVLKYSGHSLMKEDFKESQMISSYVLFNVLLTEVVQHPTSISWREENLDLRIISMLTALKKWEYTSYFEQGQVTSLKLYGLDASQKGAIMASLDEDIYKVIAYLSGDVADLCSFSARPINPDEYKDKVCLISTNQAPYSHIRLMVDTMYRLRFHGASVRRQIQAAETEDLYYYKVVNAPDTELTRFLQMLILEKFTLAR